MASPHPLHPKTLLTRVGIALALLAVTILTLRLSLKPAITDWHMQLSDPSGSRDIGPDYSDYSKKPGPFTATGNVIFDGDGTELITIIPDDCLRRLTINEREVTPQPNESWCDYNRGFSRPADSLFTPGLNRIEAELENKGGPRKFIISIPSAKIGTLAKGLLYALAVVWTVLIERWLGLAGSARTAFRIFTILSLIYLSITAPSQRTHDVFGPTGHADYIRYVAVNHSLPEVGTGWEYHQPPLYYLLSAGFLRLLGPVPLKIPWELFQGMNWFLFQLFIAVGLRALTENLAGPMRTAGVFLFALWPMNLLHASRIGNDTLACLLCSLTIYYFIRWCKNGALGDLYWTTTILALACFTKNTALPVAAVAVIFFGLVFLSSWTSRLKKAAGELFCPSLTATSPKRLLIVIALIIAAAVTSILPKLTSSHAQGMEGFLFPGVHGAPALHIEISGSTFIPFGSLTGVLSPYVSAWHDSSGRGNFWTYLFKSAQTGEFGSENQVITLLGYFYLWGSYVLLILILYGFACALRRRNGIALVLALTTAFAIAAMMVVTWAQPHASNQDFRYLYFLLYPLVMAVMWGVEHIADEPSQRAVLASFAVPIICGNALILGIALTS